MQLIIHWHLFSREGMDLHMVMPSTGFFLLSMDHLFHHVMSEPHRTTRDMVAVTQEDKNVISEFA